MEAKTRFSSKDTKRTTLGPWGNSLDFKILEPIAFQLRLGVNAAVIGCLEDGKLLLKSVRKAQYYTLDELLASLS